MTADERKSERDVTGISVLRNGHVRVEMCGNRWEEWDIAKLSEFSIKLIRELTAANEQIKRVREETIEQCLKAAASYYYVRNAITAIRALKC